MSRRSSRTTFRRVLLGFKKGYKVMFPGFWGSFSTGQITVIACVLELCWNFEPFVLARTTRYRGELKTHRRHVLEAHVGPKAPGKYKNLRWFKKVLVVIL